ncbi:asparagine synthase (glutamine-hydrolyzing) [Pancytospora epiphaga]|nr:asparagine synthase (glutamine-hydrolyzing) [Pancytospora epiphaga]
MCGILSVISSEELEREVRDDAYQRSRLQRHRGPDETGVVTFEKGVIIHERLALVGINAGHQPFTSEDGMLVFAAVGEIYNWKEAESLIFAGTGEGFVAKSDCEVIMKLYELYGAESLRYIQGMFAFVLYDKKRDWIFVARDPFGIIPFYYGYDEKGRFWAANEMKCLVGVCENIMALKPGTYLYGNVPVPEHHEYYAPAWRDMIPKSDLDIYELQSRFAFQIEAHMPLNQKVAVLLSGGLDSSLIASLAQRILRKAKRELVTYSIGLSGSPDLECARKVAEHIGSEHREQHFVPEQGIDSIREMIWHLESYDVTTIRAGIPMYLLARKIKKDGFKCVLSGEGADEIFGGYLYFHQAPSPEEFHRETARRVLNISHADCLRANKATMAWGLEARVPFLATAFVDYAMDLDPAIRMIPSTMDPEKRKCEKFILRDTFDDGLLLPKDIIWRQKEQFSDGVGYSWIDSLKNEADRQISDDEFARAGELFSYNTPDTKEAFYYRKIYHEMFGNAGEKTVMKWIPKKEWGCPTDPSGRVQKVHVDTVEK